MAHNLHGKLRRKPVQWVLFMEGWHYGLPLQFVQQLPACSRDAAEGNTHLLLIDKDPTTPQKNLTFNKG